MDFSEIFRIDKERLISYYERIKKTSDEVDEVKIIAKFLNNQSIGPPLSEMVEILNYYRNLIDSSKDLLEFAIEMIRADKIRLEYKKFLSTEQFTNLNLAIDDCIFWFFIEYDKIIRELLNKEVKEFEIATLYEIFYNTYDQVNINLFDVLEKQKLQVPTIFHGREKINTNIITIRSGLKDIIKLDYNKTQRNDKKSSSFSKLKSSITENMKVDEDYKFMGLLLERQIKSYCISKTPISSREIENAISQFLSSYFKFGKLYIYNNFKQTLVNSLAEDIYSGLTQKVKETHSLDYIKKIIHIVFEDFDEKNQGKKLDGSAWKKDLKPILNKFIGEFIKNIFD